MSRFSPTVLPDSRPRSRPGLEIAQAFSDYQNNLAIKEDRDFAKEDREIQAEDRKRRRGQEDLEGELTQIELERQLRDRYGAVPVGQAGPEVQPAPMDPTAVRGAFQETRGSLGGSAEPQTRMDAAGAPPEEVVILPGQFAGGTFSPQAVRIGGERRTFGGREYEIDPSQTAEARGAAAQEAERERLSAEEEAALQREMAALREAGVPEDRLRAVAMFDQEDQYLKPEETGFDPDRGGTFGSREEYIAFQRQLADAMDAVGRRPEKPGTEKGPITLKDALGEVDNLFGIWDGDVLTGNKLSEAERLDVAQRMAAGTLTKDDVEELVSNFPEEEGGDMALPEFAEPSAWKRFGQSVVPGGRTGGELKSDMVKPAREKEGGATVGQGRAGGSSIVDGGHRPDPAAVDSIRAIMADFPNSPIEDLKLILQDEGYDEAEINEALKGR